MNRLRRQWVMIVLICLPITVNAQSLTGPQNSVTDSKHNSPTLIYKGESLHAMSDNHYRVKVVYEEAAKMRCVAYAEGVAVAIDSVVVIPPYGVANMVINDNDKPIDKVQCWVTSTRKQDLKRDYIKHDLGE